MPPSFILLLCTFVTNVNFCFVSDYENLIEGNAVNNSVV